MKGTNALLAAAIVAALSPLASPAATLCVNPGGTGGCLATISAAVTAAAAGDTVNVAAGTYSETGIVLTRGITIQGAGRDATIVDGHGVGTVFVLQPWTSVNATLRDFTVRNGRRGIDLTGGNTGALERMRFTGNGPETGAGIFNGASILNLRDSHVDHNFANDEGGLCHDAAVSSTRRPRICEACEASTVKRRNAPETHW